MATTAVRVALRVRPLIDTNDCSISFVKDEPQVILGNERPFTFDFVFPPETSQQQLYDCSIVPLVDRFIEGQNVTVLAYGQTGSGKTYSMGTEYDTTSRKKNSDEIGILPRFAHSLFERLLEFQGSTFQVYASFLELHNEDMDDIFIASEMKHQQENPTVRQDMDDNMYWAGIKEQRIYTVDDLMCCLNNGFQKTTFSYRSHAIFSIILKQRHDDDDEIPMLIENKTAIPQRLVSKFDFVDLAGSERFERTNAIGEALGGDDHKSSSSSSTINYDKKLTRLLQDSLGENSHTLMLACVSASSSDYTETLNTLNYANRARNIQNNQDKSLEESFHLGMQIARLKSQLQMLQDVHRDEMTMQQVKQEMQEIRSFSQQLSKELAQVTSDRDTLLLGKDEPVESHPIIQQYAHQIQHLRLQIAETRNNSSQSRDFLPVPLLRPPPPPPPLLLPPLLPLKVSSSMGFFDQKNNITKKYQGSVSSTRRLTSKKKPVFQRMKTQSSPWSKKRQTHENMDELLALLRLEYEDGGEFKVNSSTDETVLHDASHARRETIATSLNLLPPSCEAEDDNNNKVFPANHILLQKYMPADNTITCAPNNTIQDDELEALAVPSWSDVPKLPSSVNGSIKRKSISLDSMWDDTNSSMTTSRVETTTLLQQQQQHHHHHHQHNPQKRSNKNLLKMLHQIQADLLVKRELVGQLERSEDQYTQMRVNYEARLNELKDHLLEIQRQRDAALAQSGTTILQLPKQPPTTVLQLRENRQAQEVRSQYEQKIKRLINENAELRKKTTQSTHSVQTARAKSDGTIGRLCADIEALNIAKKQLHKSLKVEVDKAREAAATHEKEKAQLKRRVLIAFDAKRKLDETNTAQNHVLTRKNQEILTANMQLRHLTTTLRRAASEGTFLNEVALEKILADAANLKSTSNNPTPTPTPNKPVAALGVRSRTLSPATSL